MKIIFMGTPDFSIPTLKALLKAKHEIIGIFTQPDKINSRGNKIMFSPVKHFAIENNIKYYQPTKLRDIQNFDTIKNLNPDVIIVSAYGQIIPDNILFLPKYNTLNIHPSLLPKYRGASPLQSALLNGDSKTGVTIMELTSKLDAGDIILQEEINIQPHYNLEDIHDILSDLGATLTIQALANFSKYGIIKVIQNEKNAVYTSKIDKKDLQINFNKTSKEIINKIRAFSPIPGSYSFINKKRIKIFTASYYLENISSNAIPGDIIALIKTKGLVVKTKDFAIVLESVQLENKKRISGIDLINSNLINIKDKFYFK